MSDASPRFLPLLIALSVLLWFYTTTGGRQVFVKEVLGGAYDSQAEYFLRGNVDVDAEAIGHEAMIVNDHVRMYFGPFPAFLRVPLNFVYPAGYREWSKVHAEVIVYDHCFVDEHLRSDVHIVTQKIFDLGMVRRAQNRLNKNLS